MRIQLDRVWTWRHLGYHHQPIGLLEVEGYWQPLIEFLQRSKDEGFINALQMDMLRVADDADTLLDGLWNDRQHQAGSGLARI